MASKPSTASPQTLKPEFFLKEGANQIADVFKIAGDKDTPEHCLASRSLSIVLARSESPVSGFRVLSSKWEAARLGNPGVWSSPLIGC